MKIAKYRLLPVILAAFALGLGGCMSEPVGPGPDLLGDMYFSAVQKGDFAAAAELFAPGIPRSAIIADLEFTQERFGDLQSYRRTDLVSFAASGGIRYALRYMTQYTNGHAIENVMMFQSGNDNMVRIEQVNR